MAVRATEIPLARVVSAVSEVDRALSVTEASEPLPIVNSLACLVGILPTLKLGILAEQHFRRNFLRGQGFPIVSVLEISAFAGRARRGGFGRFPTS